MDRYIPEAGFVGPAAIRARFFGRQQKNEKIIFFRDASSFAIKN